MSRGLPRLFYDVKSPDNPDYPRRLSKSCIMINGVGNWDKVYRVLFLKVRYCKEYTKKPLKVTVQEKVQYLLCEMNIYQENDTLNTSVSTIWVFKT